MNIGLQKEIVKAILITGIQLVMATGGQERQARPGKRVSIEGPEKVRQALYAHDAIEGHDATSARELYLALPTP